jgi:four helix bundle protein
MSDFKTLKVWAKGHELALLNFRLATKMSGPGAALIRNQWLRATISVPTNIAEGSGKQSDAEFVRFLRIALGSIRECEYHLILARDLGLISPSAFTASNDKTQSVGKMLTALIKSLKGSAKRHPRAVTSD